MRIVARNENNSSPLLRKWKCTDGGGIHQSIMGYSRAGVPRPACCREESSKSRRSRNNRNELACGQAKMSSSFSVNPVALMKKMLVSRDGWVNIRASSIESMTLRLTTNF